MADFCSYVLNGAARLAPSDLAPIVSMPVCDPAPGGLADRGRSPFPWLARCLPAQGLIGMFLFTGCFGWYRVVVTSGGIRIWTGLVTKFLAGAPYGSPAA